MKSLEASELELQLSEQRHVSLLALQQDHEACDEAKVA